MITRYLGAGGRVLSNSRVCRRSLSVMSEGALGHRRTNFFSHLTGVGLWAACLALPCLACCRCWGFLAGQQQRTKNLLFFPIVVGRDFHCIMI